MGKYIVKRVLLAIISILIVSAITFFVMNIIPGGPFNKEKATSAEAQKVLEERYNLDKPIPEQYVIYMNNLLHGDWGVSLHSGRDIWGEISSRFKVSAKLGGMAALVAIVAWYGDAVLRACNTASSGVLLKARLVPGMVVHESELCTADHRAECLSDGVYHTSDKDQYAGFPEPGLHPYRESEGCSGLESHFQTCTAQCADSGNHLRGTDGCIHFDRFHGC